LSTFHRLIKLEEDTSEVFEYYSDLIDFYEGRLQDIEAAAKIYKEANELADKFPNVEAALDIRFGYFSYLTISCKFNENDGSKEKLKEEVLKVFYKMIELESDKEEICEEYDSLGDFYIEKMNDYEAAIGVYEEALGKYKFKEDDQEWLQDKLETAKERARSKNKVNIVINPFVLSTIVIIAIIFAICCKFIK